MSELRIETCRMPAADLGPENPLPHLQARKSDWTMRVDESVSQEDRQFFGFGGRVGPLPHRIQDGFDRLRRDRDFRVAVLENDKLRATFLLDFGGRLWSLVHKPTGREMLHRNPIFQPCNLAVRNAWIAGGVEWNIGIVGHTPYNLSPLFAAVVNGAGQPVLRFYEWDRIRGTPYQIDAYLPDGSAFLMVRIRIVNPHDQVTPMYWWSNIAVAESPDVRVLAPADEAITHGYAGGIRMVSVPQYDGVDTTYATNLSSSRDFFYKIPEGHRRWVSALDAAGRGLVQTSTSLLKGRKLFAWGMGAGGRHWQDFLCTSGHPYIEIQAGLARTQMECLPMPPRATWEWLEAYGLMEAQPAAVHGKDWAAAVGDVHDRLEQTLPAAWMEQELKRTAAVADRKPEKIIRRGSGWGRLELRRRERASRDSFCPPGLVFDEESLSPDQAPWLDLLEKGEFRCASPEEEPGCYMVEPAWQELLEQGIASGRSDHWLAWLHLGVMHNEAGQVEQARGAWRESMQRTPSAWALRNLAVLAVHERRVAEAADLYLAAQRLLPGARALAIECCCTLLDAGRAQDVLDVLAAAPQALQLLGRLRLLQGRAYVALGQLGKVEAILADESLVVADMREGEVTLSDLWFAMHERRISDAEGRPIDEALKQRVRRDLPPPTRLDYRMNAFAG